MTDVTGLRSAHLAVLRQYLAQAADAYDWSYPSAPEVEALAARVASYLRDPGAPEGPLLFDADAALLARLGNALVASASPLLPTRTAALQRGALGERLLTVSAAIRDTLVARGDLPRASMPDTRIAAHAPPPRADT